MRTMSRLRAFCHYPEQIEKPFSKKRDEAAASGTLLHKYAEEWIRATLDGRVFHCDGAPEPVATWLRRLRATWKPPKGIEVEIPMGLVEGKTGLPEYVAVEERPPGSHQYVRTDGKAEPLVTAGRTDWVWWDDDDVALQVIDVKSGSVYLGPPDQIRQLQAQGLAAACRAEVGAFRIGVYYARLGLFDMSERIEVTGPVGTRMWDDVRRAATMDSEPHSGPWCLGCYSKRDCVSNPEITK